MAPASVQSTGLDAILRRSDVLLAIGVIAILGVLIIPIPPALLDFALAFNITFSLVILLTTLYIKRPLELSVFPGLLLIVTLLRLSLNVASTRLILSEAFAGDVINSFGNFVVKIATGGAFPLGDWKVTISTIGDDAKPSRYPPGAR